MSVFTVTDLGDKGPGTLRSTISDAADGDTIEFSPMLAGETITLTTGGIVIDVGLHIEGLGANRLTVSSDSKSEIFDIEPDAGTVTISGLTIENGLSDEGGAILDDGSSLTLASCTFSGNQAVGTPGASSSDGGFATGRALEVLAESTTSMTVSITGCTFVNNSATGGAGGTGGGNGPDGGGGAGGYANGGALAITVSGLAVETQLTIARCAITHNSCESGTGGAGGSGGMGGAGAQSGGAYGGGLWLGAAPGGAGDTWTLDTDTISYNVAVDGGGGAGGTGINGTGGTGGFASQPLGGGVYDDAGAELEILHCTIIDNMAVVGGGGAGGTGTAGDGASGTSGTSAGGGIFTEGPTFMTPDTKITGNQADTYPDVDRTGESSFAPRKNHPSLRENDR